MFTLELGQRAKDKITGFEGILTSRCEFLTGCNRYCIQPTELRDGKPVDSLYFDEACLEIVGEGISAKEVQGEERGACSPDPSR
jgi:hypothetical protein